MNRKFEIREKYCKEKNLKTFLEYDVAKYADWLENELAECIEKLKKLKKYERQIKGLWCTDNINCVPKENQVLFTKLRGIRRK